MTKACRLTFDLLSVGCHVFDPGCERRRVCITDVRVVEEPLGCRCAPTWFNSEVQTWTNVSRISHSHYLRWFFSLLLWAEITVSWKIKCKKNTSDLPFSYFWSEPGRTAEVLKSVIEWTCCWNWSWAGFKLTDGQTALMQVDYCDSKVFTAFTAQTHKENLKQHQMKPISSISNLLLPQRIKAKWQAFILKFQSQATFAYPRSDLIESFSSNKDNYGKRWWAAEFHAALWNISKMKWDFIFQVYRLKHPPLQAWCHEPHIEMKILIKLNEEDLFCHHSSFASLVLFCFITTLFLTNKLSAWVLWANQLHCVPPLRLPVIQAVQRISSEIFMNHQLNLLLHHRVQSPWCYGSFTRAWHV